MGSLRRLGDPVPARVEASARDGRPGRVDGHEVEAVRESWLVEDRWWAGAPLRRRYWELVLGGGRCVVVFRDLESGGWFAQPA
jgi:hypothetical protein